MSFYLGIDGGGSKTSCLIGNESSVLGRGTGPGSNIVRTGEGAAREAFATAIQQACAESQIIPQRITKTCVGVAGAARPQISEVVHRLLAELIGGEVEVTGDMVIALEAAFGTGPGVIVIAGTGSIAYGRNAAGQITRAGGWGFAISDEGSGHWIGRAAISAAMRAWDQNEDENQAANSVPPLAANILKSWSLETREQLVLAGNASPPPDFASLVPDVIASADSGDPLACGVLTRAAGELSAIAATVSRRLFSDVLSVPVAMSGGVFANSPLVREVFYNSLRSELPNATIMPTVVEPVQGALSRARRAES
jgi:glucosamine kinase